MTANEYRWQLNQDAQGQAERRRMDRARFGDAGVEAPSSAAIAKQQLAEADRLIDELEAVKLQAFDIALARITAAKPSPSLYHYMPTAYSEGRPAQRDEVPGSLL